MRTLSFGLILLLCAIAGMTLNALSSPPKYKVGDCFEYHGRSDQVFEVIQTGKYGSLEAINHSPGASFSTPFSIHDLEKTEKIDCFDLFEKKESK